VPVNKSKQGGTIGGASISPMGGEITGDRRHERERKTERRERGERKRKRNRVLFILDRSIFGIEKSEKTSGTCKLTVRLHAALSGKTLVRRKKLPFNRRR